MNSTRLALTRADIRSPLLAAPKSLAGGRRGAGDHEGGQGADGRGPPTFALDLVCVNAIFA